jgi:hypothetical protein
MRWGAWLPRRLLGAPEEVLLLLVLLVLLLLLLLLLLCDQDHGPR